MRVKVFVCWGSYRARKPTIYKTLHLTNPDRTSHTLCGREIPDCITVRTGSSAKRRTTIPEWLGGVPLKNCMRCFKEEPQEKG